jgi:hypothetical protein
MKTRNGLVSNSSCASFICYWSHEHPDLDLMGALVNLFQNDYYGEGDCTLRTIKDHTQPTNSKGTFKTSGFTSMYNTIEDCPDHLTKLVMMLASNQAAGFSLIDFRVEHD